MPEQQKKNVTITCHCGYSSTSLQEVLQHEQAAHPERRSNRLTALRNLAMVLSHPQDLPDGNER